MMRRAFLALIVSLFSIGVAVPAHAQSTRAQINTYFSGTSGAASATNCFPTSGTGNITAATLRTCMLELVASISAMYQDTLVTIQGALTVNGNFSLTGSGSGATIVKAPATGGGTATFFPGSDTIVGAAATQTLTNKSIAGSEINSGLVLPSVGGTGVNNGSNTLTLGNSVTVTGSAGPNVAVWNSNALTGTTTLPSALTVPSPTFTGTVAGASTIPNSVLVNSSTTIAGTVCTLGSTCSPGGTATSFLTYGTPGSGNDTTAFNTFIAACGAAATKQCYLPAGQYNFTTAPNCINQQINLFGDNIGSTVLLRNYNEADPTRGLLCISTFAANDSSIGNFGIYGKSGTTGGSLISINQGVGSPIGFLHFHDINMSTTGSCTHEYGLYINGTANSVAPIGVRDLDFANITIFGANTYSVYVAGVVGLAFQGGGGIFPAGCVSANSGDVIFAGTAAVNSTQVFFNPPTMQALIGLDYTNSATFLTNSLGAVGGSSVTNTANVTNVAVMATSFGGACQSNWITSNCVATTSIASAIGVLAPANGGTGVNNGTNTITISGGNFNTTGGPVSVDASSNGLAVISGTAITGASNITLNLSWTGFQRYDQARTIASAAGALWDDANWSAQTTTLTGNTNITTAAGFNKIEIAAPTISAASALTITQAASLYIASAPVGAGAGPATITNTWSFHTGAGHVYLQSANGTSGITDGFGASRNCGLCQQRVVSSLTGSPYGLAVDMQNNNSVAAQTTVGMLTLISTPASNAVNHASMTGWLLSAETLGTGIVSTLQGGSVFVGSASAGTVSTSTGINIGMVNNAASSTVTQTNGVSIGQPQGTASGTAVWGNINGILIGDQKPSGAGTNTLSTPPIAIAINSQTAAGAFAFKQSGLGINQFQGDIYYANLAVSHTAPTIASGFCTSPTIATNNTASFQVTVGSACAGSVGSITMPAATTGWSCNIANVTTPASNTPWQTSSSTTAVGVTNYVRTTGVAGNFTASDKLNFQCTAF